MPYPSADRFMNSTPQASFVDIKGVSKHYGSTKALDDVSMTIERGEIVGLIGPNGAGKSTLLKAIMGLIHYSGSLTVFGNNPYQERTKILQDLSYIADVASLPSWMKVNDLVDFVDEVHPKFDAEKCRSLLQPTPIELAHIVGELSKGMKTRLHLCLILSINTDLLILDEPTLGLDVMVRREFQDRLVADYYNQDRSILVTTHQVDEIESILTRVVFIREGKISLDFAIAELKDRYTKVVSNENVVFADPAIKPVYQRQLPAHTEFIFADIDASELQKYGEVKPPSLEDLFVAVNS